MNLDTHAENTWCPGCGNFGIESTVKDALNGLEDEGYLKKEDVVISAGIGCSGKIFDYLDLNGYYSVHGRTPANIAGMMMVNPDLTGIAFAGDGDSLGEGLAHTIHAAKKNVDMTMVIHNNRVYGLTTGQFTPTSKKGFKGKSTPQGSSEEPFNIIDLMISSNATFVARAFVTKKGHYKDIMKKAIKHEGFSFVEVLQPCVTFNNTYQLYNEKCQIIEEHDPSDKEKARELSYREDEIPLGIFYKEEKPIWREGFSESYSDIEKKKDSVKKILNKD